MDITITKYPSIRSSTYGASLYWHRVQYSKDGYGYDCTMSDEGMGTMIQALELANNTVTFVTKE